MPGIVIQSKVNIFAYLYVIRTEPPGKRRLVTAPYPPPCESEPVLLYRRPLPTPPPRPMLPPRPKPPLPPKRSARPLPTDLLTLLLPLLPTDLVTLPLPLLPPVLRILAPPLVVPLGLLTPRFLPPDLLTLLLPLLPVWLFSMALPRVVPAGLLTPPVFLFDPTTVPAFLPLRPYFLTRSSPRSIRLKLPLPPRLLLPPPPREGLSFRKPGLSGRSVPPGRVSLVRISRSVSRDLVSVRTFGTLPRSRRRVSVVRARTSPRSWRAFPPRTPSPLSLRRVSVRGCRTRFLSL